MVTSAGSRATTVTAWDLPTRLFHWLLLALIASAWVSVEYSESLNDELLLWHRWNGLAILTVLVWRVLWGFVGSQTSRFGNFAGHLRRAVRFSRDVIANRAPRYLGHNPLGWLMVMALMLALFAQAAFGLFAVDDNDLTGGPLYRLLDEAGNKLATRWHHRIFAYVLLPLAGLHIAANLYYTIVKREPLIQAMLTGEKPALDYADVDVGSVHVVESPLLRAFVCLVAAKLIVFGSIFAIGGTLF